MWINILLIMVLGICVITDLQTRKIYNIVIFPSLLIAVGLHLYTGGWDGASRSFLGFVVGLGLLIIPYMLSGIGAGDVKLLALVGALKGTSFVIAAAVYMALLGAVIAVVVLLSRRETRQALKPLVFFLYGLRYGIRVPLYFDRKALSATYPYGVAIAGGSFMSMISMGWFG